MKNLTPEIAMLVIQQLNLHEGCPPDVPDDQLAEGVCLNLAAHAWLESRGGREARWALVDLLVTALAGAAPGGADLARPLAMISRARLTAGRLTESETSTMRAACMSQASACAVEPCDAPQHRREYEMAFWTVAHLAVVIADGQGDHDFQQALAYAAVDLCLFTEVSEAVRQGEVRHG